MVLTKVHRTSTSLPARVQNPAKPQSPVSPKMGAEANQTPLGIQGSNLESDQKSQRWQARRCKSLKSDYPLNWTSPHVNYPGSGQLTQQHRKRISTTAQNAWTPPKTEKRLKQLQSSLGRTWDPCNPCEAPLCHSQHVHPKSSHPPLARFSISRDPYMKNT